MIRNETKQAELFRTPPNLCLALSIVSPMEKPDTLFIVGLSGCGDCCELPKRSEAGLPALKVELFSLIVYAFSSHIFPFPLDAIGRQLIPLLLIGNTFGRLLLPGFIRCSGCWTRMIRKTRPFVMKRTLCSSWSPCCIFFRYQHRIRSFTGMVSRRWPGYWKSGNSPFAIISWGHRTSRTGSQPSRPTIHSFSKR